MTGFEVVRRPYTDATGAELENTSLRFANWPVVYVLNDDLQVYVGETANAARRMREHRRNPAKARLDQLRIVLDDRFNKSVCLDLEAFLTRYFHGDGSLEVLNNINRLTTHDYFDRDTYRNLFKEIFEELRDHELFTRPIPEIEKSELFKYSPFKSLNRDQAAAIEEIVEGLFADIEARRMSSIVVEGAPGTGKTIVAVSLLKMLRDIGLSDAHSDVGESVDEDEPRLATAERRQVLKGYRFGLVVPQQSLRATLKHVFDKTHGLSGRMVLSPFDVGEAPEMYDLLVIDESHRLKLRAGLANGVQYDRYDAVSRDLFGSDATITPNQADWIRARSYHQVWLLDSEQSVLPSDIPMDVQLDIRDAAQKAGRYYELRTQMRMRVGFDYVRYVRDVLSDRPPSSPPETFAPYDVRLYDDFGAMVRAIRGKEAEHGLARLVAGYAWPWRSKKDKSLDDIEIDGLSFKWNQTDTRWIESGTSPDEVGSIHTVQGYDLNYAGVIIGPDLRFDPGADRIVFDRANYFDRKGKSSPRKLGIAYTDDDLLVFVRRIYAVLLTRGIRGTYIYVCDPALRERLRPYFPAASVVDDVPSGADDVGSLAPAWRAALADVPPAERELRDLLHALADLSALVPAPTVHGRTPDGTRCLLTWPLHRVAVVREHLAGGARTQVTAPGWTVVGPGSEAIREALAEAMSRSR
ncbi:DUF2075 domain-containing protein [Myceligenerans xiligouense]|uniref:GIY-YIG domain-containing protein n=1 Tax=Myceligenerans xiligouense TaxID=253184 RepID=A0A3N4Z4R6_9MICO|nr:DUF2075 domain-containing protein [Myceligenerans xiligouense]RPF20908.1 hypothetical protein EDD34_1515 [Myceligenerans xiligouense]